MSSRILKNILDIAEILCYMLVLFNKKAPEGALSYSITSNMNIKAAPLTGSNPTAQAPIIETPRERSKFILTPY